MKESEIIIERIVITILVMVGFYLLGAYIAWDFNPNNWQLFSEIPTIGRIIALILLIMSFSIAYQYRDVP